MRALQTNLTRILLKETNKINKRLTSIKDRLSLSSTLIENNRKDIVDIRNTLSSLASRINAVENKSALGPSSANVDMPNLTSQNAINDVASELQDRSLRSCNLILYNLASDENSDAIKVKEILSKISNVNVENIFVRRLSKPSRRNNIPPILVRLSSSHEAARVIHNWKLLPPEINVTADRTPSQKAHFKWLKILRISLTAPNPKY